MRKTSFQGFYEMTCRKRGDVPSPLWGGLGRGARHLVHSIRIRNDLVARTVLNFQPLDKWMAPLPNPPHKGEGLLSGAA